MSRGFFLAAEALAKAASPKPTAPVLALPPRRSIFEGGCILLSLIRCCTAGAFPRNKGKKPRGCHAHLRAASRLFCKLTGDLQLRQNYFIYRVYHAIGALHVGHNDIGTATGSILDFCAAGEVNRKFLALESRHFLAVGELR